MNSNWTWAPSASSHVDHALFLAEQGFRVFPCYGLIDGECTCKDGVDCTDPGKHPHLHNGFKGATTFEPWIRRWWTKWPHANIAIATGGDLLVVDVDPRHGGDQIFQTLESDLGPLPRSMSVTTGGGGLHVYLTIPNNMRLKSKGNWVQGIDTRAQGGYVIAPPSSHASGDHYAWNTPVIGKPEPVPRSWMRALDRIAIKHGQLPRSGKQIRPRRLPSSATEIQEPGHGMSRPEGRSEDQRELVEGIGGPELSVTFPGPGSDGGLSIFSDTGKRAWAAARRCLVTERGTTNLRITALATSLKNIPELANQSAESVRHFVHWWFKNSVQHMTVTEWDAVWKRWQYLWQWALTETGAAWDARDELVNSGFLQIAKWYFHKRPARIVLRRLCHLMQEYAGDGEWYLSVRTAQDVLASLGYEITLMTVSRWLKQFVAEGLLIRTRQHHRGSLFAQRFILAKIAVSKHALRIA